jgi:hypothetical protein
LGLVLGDADDGSAVAVEGGVAVVLVGSKSGLGVEMIATGGAAATEGGVTLGSLRGGGVFVPLEAEVKEVEETRVGGGSECCSGS